MSSALVCRELTKRYPGRDRFALGDADAGVSLEVEKGELFALLGPSGCGKTTTLRIVGGFVTATTGTVEVDGRDITKLPPYRRPINTVFQSYALFPHMSLGANVEFGLAMDRVSRPERHRRAAEALEMVGLGGQQRRHVTELSGGESQRAALARALVKRPALLLLDEPLGALDLKLRQEMQRELVRLKTTTSATFVHVTHDQEEACAMADRIAVMRDGKIVQIDTPLALYQYPRTSYVASFINAGTLVRGTSRRYGNEVEIVTPDVTVRGRLRADLNGAQSIAAVIPRDGVEIHPPDATELGSNMGGVTGTVERLAFTGSVFDVALKVSDDLVVAADLQVDDMRRFAEPLSVGAPARASWAVDDIILVEDA